ncbi:Hypp2713 [Branchiostoma lanceolatum]|uniref:Hypp2713 protein n=1 Tax=Branchiostoma lanceolatum TaxID=7740 RepID=A0A8K0EU48_BRALA|nr:Hypp2713 [Branchiostoma lanceolatum]
MEPHMLRYVLKLEDRVARGLVWQHYEGRKTARMSIRPSKPAGNVNFNLLQPSTTQTPGFSGGKKSSVTRELLPGLSASPALQSDSDGSGDDLTTSESFGSARCRGMVRAVQPANRNHLLVIPDTSSDKRPAVTFGRRRAVVKRSTRGDQRCETTGGTETVDLIYMDGCLYRQKRPREEDDSEVSPCAKRHLTDVDYDASDVDYDADDESH